MIIAVDPGCVQSAYLILHGKNIVSSSKLVNFELRRLLTHMDGYRVLAIEGMQSYGLPVGREVLDTVVWIGRFIEASTAPNIWPVFRPAVRAYFLGVTKKGVKSGDAAIRKAMLARYGAEHTHGLHSDQWSALALATYVADKEASGAKPPVYPVSMLPHYIAELHTLQTNQKQQTP